MLAGSTLYCTVSRSSSSYTLVCGPADARLIRLRVNRIVSIANGWSVLLGKALSRARSASVSSWGAAVHPTLSGVGERLLRLFTDLFPPTIYVVRSFIIKLAVRQAKCGY